MLKFVESEGFIEVFDIESKYPKLPIGMIFKKNKKYEPNDEGYGYTHETLLDIAQYIENMP